MKRILSIIGARPQIIKAAALSRTIKESFAIQIEEKILHTGQHYDANMSQVFFDELGIPPADVNLQIGSGNHGEQTAKMIAGIEQVLLSESFDAVVVYGDTNSTLAGAVAAAKMHIPVIHIEAGLRSFDMAMPEEQNRIVCDHLSSLLFAPTQVGWEHLNEEGLVNSKAVFKNGKSPQVYISGDIMYDNSLYFAQLAEAKRGLLDQYNLATGEYVLATVHRDNNTDSPQRLENIFTALLKIAEQTNVVLPLHPRTRKMLPLHLSASLQQRLQHSNTLRLIPPVSFMEMIELEKNAQVVVTDSGGVQKEAYYFKKPCVILRAETEWVEILTQRAGILADAEVEKIVSAYEELSTRDIDYPSIFGNGKAALFIVEKILTYLS